MLWVHRTSSLRSGGVAGPVAELGALAVTSPLALSHVAVIHSLSFICRFRAARTYRFLRSIVTRRWMCPLAGVSSVSGRPGFVGSRVFTSEIGLFSAAAAEFAQFCDGFLAGVK